jgi:hypothetical protein
MASGHLQEAGKPTGLDQKFLGDAAAMDAGSADLTLFAEPDPNPQGPGPAGCRYAP